MMRADTALTRMRELPVVDYRQGFGSLPPLILAPHPDDESLGCGGLITEGCRQGTPPIVVVLTDGSMSHPNSATFPRNRLRALRESETIEATGHCGLPADRVRFLRYLDTEAPRTGKPLHEVAAHLADLVEKQGCGCIVVPWRHDPHCDHEAASLIAEAAGRLCRVRVFAYPVWGWTLPAHIEVQQPPFTGFRLDVSAHLAAKRRAILAHRSQYAGLIQDDVSGFQMSGDFIELFLNRYETFLEMERSH